MGSGDEEGEGEEEGEIGRPRNDQTIQAAKIESKTYINVGEGEK